MAALLVGMSVMAVLMGALLPVWTTMAKREKEAELVFRGNQYARAIGLFQRKFANTPPPTIDVLVEQRFLRKKYKDPITNDDFQPLYANQATTPVGPGGQQQGAAARNAGRAWRTAHSARLWRHWRDLRRRHRRCDLEEQGHLAEGLQRTHQVQRVGVRSRSDVPTAGAAGGRRTAGSAGRKSAWRRGRAAAGPFTIWHATGFIPEPEPAAQSEPAPGHAAAASGRWDSAADAGPGRQLALWRTFGLAVQSSTATTSAGAAPSRSVTIASCSARRIVRIPSSLSRDGCTRFDRITM